MGKSSSYAGVTIDFDLHPETAIFEFQTHKPLGRECRSSIRITSTHNGSYSAPPGSAELLQCRLFSKLVAVAEHWQKSPASYRVHQKFRIRSFSDSVKGIEFDLELRIWHCFFNRIRHCPTSFLSSSSVSNPFDDPNLRVD